MKKLLIVLILTIFACTTIKTSKNNSIEFTGVGFGKTTADARKSALLDIQLQILNFLGVEVSAKTISVEEISESKEEYHSRKELILDAKHTLNYTIIDEESYKQSGQYKYIVKALFDKNSYAEKYMRIFNRVAKLMREPKLTSKQLMELQTFESRYYKKINFELLKELGYSYNEYSTNCN